MWDPDTDRADKSGHRVVDVTNRMVRPIRLAVGLGNPDRERALLPWLVESGEFIVAERPLTAEQLLACLQREQVDLALISRDLHRLTDASLRDLARTRVPLVLLPTVRDDPDWREVPGVVVAPDTDVETVRNALHAALRGERPVSHPFIDPLDVDPAEPASAAEMSPAPAAVIAVASGAGSPGRTTVALNVAVALGAVGPTVLVDADLTAPSLAAFLDADPTRNLYMLAHAEPETPSDWERAIDRETQPLGLHGAGTAVLCGVPKPNMCPAVSPRFFEQLVTELQARYRYVILDVGAELMSADAAVHRVAVGAAQQILLIAGANLVGLAHAWNALDGLKNRLGVSVDRVELIINGHDRRYHHDVTEIEWALGLVAAAVIPYDHDGVERALLAQRPLVLDRRSRAARALLDLAACLHGTSTGQAPKASDGRGVGWLMWRALSRLSWPRRAGAKSNTLARARDGDERAELR